MASAFGHGFAGLAMASAYESLVEKQPLSKKFWLCSLALPILPDADAIGYFAGVPYSSMLGHRGFTHSLCFALLLALLVTRFLFKDSKPGTSLYFKRTAFFFLATASHGFLDAMTTGGLGVGFLIPFSGERFFFPLRPIRVSPIGVTAFFSARGAVVIGSELLYVALPAAALAIGARFLARARSKASTS